MKAVQQRVKGMGLKLLGMYKGVNKLVPISLCLQGGNRGGKGEFWIEVKLQLVKEVYSFYGWHCNVVGHYNYYTAKLLVVITEIPSD